MTWTRWVCGAALPAMLGCTEVLDIDTIDYRPSAGAGAGGSGGESATGGAGGSAGGSDGGSLEPIVNGHGCAEADLCGASNTSCCESRLVPGSSLGSYRMGCNYVPGRPCSPESMGPEHEATVGDFYLDTFEATVGRFRQFEEEYNGWRESGHPSPGEGSHPRIPASGWKLEWDELLPLGGSSFDFELACESGFYSYKIDSDPALAQNCLTWPLAFAFCIWTGGRLPTEAEWEMAATGAEENRLWAWGIDTPTAEHAVYNVDGEIPPLTFWLGEVGSKPLGVGRFGHFDLSGNIGEWALDQFSDTWFDKGSPGNPCNDCANLGAAGDTHVLRGGSWSWDEYDMLATARDDEPGEVAAERFGVRCARDFGSP